MLHTRAQLDRFHELLKRGHSFQLKAGLRIGRGFADIGYEEYSVLSGFNVVSLLTGQLSTLAPDYERFHFPIYTADELSSLLFEHDCDITDIKFDDQRTWVMSVSIHGPVTEQFEAESLEELFLTALLWKLDFPLASI